MITEKRIIEILHEQGMKDEEINKEANLINDFTMDSLDMIELKMIFEEEIGIEIPDKDFYEIKTVGDMISYLQRK